MNFYCFEINTKCFDFCFWISTFVVPLITYLVIQMLRPRLQICSSVQTDETIKVKVVNKSWFFYAHNLKVEVCIFNKEEGTTYHFQPDHVDFLILPNKDWFNRRDNTKTFISRTASQSAMVHLKLEANNQNLTPEEGFAMLLEKRGYKIRFRCHATHSFSGLGKSFEKIF